MNRTAAHDDPRAQLCCDPDLAALVRAELDHTDPALRDVLAAHLAAPHTPAILLAADAGVDLATVSAAYHHARTCPNVAHLVGSSYYPYRLRYAFATATVAEWRRRPDIPDRILAREPVLRRDDGDPPDSRHLPLPVCDVSVV